LVVTDSQVQNIDHKTLSLDRAKLADIPEPMTEEQAWAKFEDAMRNIESFDEAIAWLNKNPEVKEGLTVYEMMRQFNRDIREANKYYRN
jgi:hypothetical protein